MSIFWRRSIPRALLFAFLLHVILTWFGVYQTPPLPFLCTKFTETYWAEFNFNVDSPDDVASTVSRLWGIEKDRLSDYGNGVDWSSIKLNRPLGFYTAWFRDGILQKIDVKWTLLPTPSLSQAVDSLGAPEYCIVYYGIAPEAVNINLDLLYPEKGIVVRFVSPFTSPFRPEPPQEFHPYMRIRELAVVAPGTPEQMVPALYSIGDVGGYVDNACLSKRWPGSIEAMEIAPLSEFSYCQNRGEESE